MKDLSMRIGALVLLLGTGCSTTLDLGDPPPTSGDPPSGSSGDASTGAGSGGSGGGDPGEGGSNDGRVPWNLFVDGANGDDDAPGTEEAPLRTVGRALERVSPHRTIEIGCGVFTVYDCGIVPEGVTLRGSDCSYSYAMGTSIWGPGAGPGSCHGLRFEDGGTVENLTLDMFSSAISASNGSVTVNDVRFLLQNYATGIELDGDAAVELNDAWFGGPLSAGASAIELDAASTLVMNGGRIESLGDGNCFGNLVSGAISARGASSLELTGVLIEDMFGTAIEARDSADVVLRAVSIDGVDGRAIEVADEAELLIAEGSTIRNAGATSCAVGGDVGDEAVYAAESAHVSLDASGIEDSGSTAVRALGQADFRMDGGWILRSAREAVVLDGDGGFFAATNSRLEESGTDGLRLDAGQAWITDSTISNNGGAGVSVRAGANLRARGSTFTGNLFGVQLTGPAALDLGRTEPGGNLLRGNTTTAIRFGFATPNASVYVMQGNTWTPLSQGADDKGIMPTMGDAALCGLVAGANFTLDHESVCVASFPYEFP
jgi:hypothetical protein